MSAATHKQADKLRSVQTKRPKIIGLLGEQGMNDIVARPQFVSNGLSNHQASDWSRDRAWSGIWGKAFHVVAAFALCTTHITGLIYNEDANAPTTKTTAENNAQSTNADKAKASSSRELIIAAYGGAPYTYPSDVQAIKSGAHDFTVKGVDWTAKPFKSPIYYGVRVVRWGDTGRFGSMLDFTHSKAIAELAQNVKATGQIAGQPVPEDGPLNQLFERLEFSHGHNMLSVNGLFRLGSIAPSIWPYVGAGVGINLPHSEVQLKTDDKRSYEYQYTGPMAQGLIGLELRTSKVSYFVEYKFTLANYFTPLTELEGTSIGLFADLYRQFNRWMSGEEPPGGWVGTQLNSHQAIAGAGVRLRSPAAAAK